MGLFRGQADAAAQGVSAEIGGLGAPQHLDALNVHDGRVAGAAVDAEIIHIKRESGRPEGGVDIQEVGGSPDAQLAAGPGARGRPAGVRGADNVIAHILKHEGLNRIGVERGDADRHILQVLLAPLGGHHHFFDAGAVFLRRDNARQSRP